MGEPGWGFLQKLRTPGATGFFSPKCRIKEKRRRRRKKQPSHKKQCTSNQGPTHG